MLLLLLLLLTLPLLLLLLVLGMTAPERPIRWQLHWHGRTFQHTCNGLRLMYRSSAHVDRVRPRDRPLDPQ